MNKPVAWWTGKFDDESEDFIFPETRQKFIDHPIAKNHLLFPIPLYTHPVKELHLSLQKSQDGELLAVTYTDDEHRIVEVLWEKPPVKELTDEEIIDIWFEVAETNSIAERQIQFAKAILRKAQEK